MIRTCLLLLAVSATGFAQKYAVTGTIPLGGVGRWDYLRVDPAAGRLYVSHGDEVDVINVKTERLAGKLTGLGLIHGIVFVPGKNLGFLGDGGKDEVVRFDPRNLRILGRTADPPKPNSMVYDPSSRRLFVGHKPSDSMTVISVPEGKVEKTIELGGRPEFPVADGRGNVFVNIQDKSEIVRIDTHTLRVTGHWPLAPCFSPSGLAISTASHRLFSACDNNLMAIVDADTGRVVATEPIGQGPDAAAYDDRWKLAFASTRDGVLTVIADRGGDRYAVVQKVVTEKGARTMALDPKSHEVFLTTAALGPTPEPSETNQHPRPVTVPGTFHVIVVKPVQKH